jgi:hypothetical protein
MLSISLVLASALAGGVQSAQRIQGTPMPASDAMLVPLRFPEIQAGLPNDETKNLVAALPRELEFALPRAGFKLLGPEAAHSALDVSIKVESFPDLSVAEIALGDETGVVLKTQVQCTGYCNAPGANARSFAAEIAKAMLVSDGLKKFVVEKRSHTDSVLATRKSTAARARLAVLELRNYSSLAPENVRYFGDLIREAVLQSAPAMDVMTRENLVVLLGASGKTLENCEGECEVDTGRRIGADAIVSGEIQKLGSNYKLSLRLHSTADGRLISAGVASGQNLDELDKDARRVVSTFAEKLR